jgi:trehalose 6-phosphate phosphatase
MKFDDLPVLTESILELKEKLKNKKPAVFLDYDGTLTPIVPNPEDATLTEEARQVLRDLSRRCFVAIVSGRDRADVKSLVNLDELVYSGSHGFDSAGPGFIQQHEGGKKLLPDFDKAEKELTEMLSAIPGARVDRKLFAIAVHYRHVAEEQVSEVQKIVDEIMPRFNGFKKTGGKKIIELKPNMDWDKGKAVNWLLEKLNLNNPDILPIYIGDDFTDEDAFKTLKEIGGVGILVGDHGEKSDADFRLFHPEEVKDFLKELIVFLDED